MAEELSIQTNISILAQRLNQAEYTLSQLWRLHVADELGVDCVSCQQSWPCALYRILDKGRSE